MKQIFGLLCLTACSQVLVNAQHLRAAAGGQASAADTVQSNRKLLKQDVVSPRNKGRWMGELGDKGLWKREYGVTWYYQGLMTRQPWTFLPKTARTTPCLSSWCVILVERWPKRKKPVFGIKWIYMVCVFLTFGLMG